MENDFVFGSLLIRFDHLRLFDAADAIEKDGNARVVVVSGQPGVGTQYFISCLYLRE